MRHLKYSETETKENTPENTPISGEQWDKLVTDWTLKYKDNYIVNVGDIYDYDTSVKYEYTANPTTYSKVYDYWKTDSYKYVTEYFDSKEVYIKPYYS